MPKVIDPTAQAIFNRWHPKHVGHIKYVVPVISLSYQADCSCGDRLHVSIAAMMVGSVDEKGRIAAASPAPAKDDRFPHVCPRCGGPAYIGALDVDCKTRCKK
jgi:hypothetical protein